MEPVRDDRITLVDLLDRALDKGLLLNADLIISLAGVPLIGVKLNAAIASVETLLKYGVMADWIQAQRLVKASPDHTLMLAEGEKLVRRFYGSLYIDGGLYPTWKYTFFYVTNRRLLLATKEPYEVLAEIYYEQIEIILEQTPLDTDDNLGCLCFYLKTDRCLAFRLSEMSILKSTVEDILSQKRGLS